MSKKKAKKKVEKKVESVEGALPEVLTAQNLPMRRCSHVNGKTVAVFRGPDGDVEVSLPGHLVGKSSMLRLANLALKEIES